MLTVNKNSGADCASELTKNMLEIPAANNGGRGGWKAGTVVGSRTGGALYRLPMMADGIAASEVGIAASCNRLTQACLQLSVSMSQTE